MKLSKKLKESKSKVNKDTLYSVKEASSLVKEIATLGGDVSRFVPPNVKAALLEKISS